MRVTINRNVETQIFSTSMCESLDRFADQSNLALALLCLATNEADKRYTRNITIKRDKTMTYLPIGKESVMNDNGNWAPDGRQMAKYGKVFKKVLKEWKVDTDFSDKEMEDLVNFFKATQIDGNFKIVEGEDIRDWYHYERTLNDKQGSLSGSCMRYDECQDYMDIYVDNPDKIKMLILTKDGSLIGRALLWKPDGYSEFKFMDRIYGSDSTISKFLDYAVENNLYRKERQTFSDTAWISPDLDTESIDLIVTVAKTYRHYPFLDTFYYFDENSRELANGDHISYSCTLQDTGGGFSESDRCWSDYHGEYINEDDAIWIASIDDHVYYEDTVELYNGERELEENCIYLEYRDQYAYQDDDDLVDLANGTSALLEDVTFCEYSDEAYLTDDDVVHWYDEIDMTVHEDYKEEAFEDAGVEIEQE